jgi:hypothetical protein
MSTARAARLIDAPSKSLRPRQTSAAARRASNTPNAVAGRACCAAAVAPAVWHVTSRMIIKSASVVPTSSAMTQQVYQMARAAGLNKEDGSSIIKVFERMAGVTIGDCDD